MGSEGESPVYKSSHPGVILYTPAIAGLIFRKKFRFRLDVSPRRFRLNAIGVKLAV